MKNRPFIPLLSAVVALSSFCPAATASDLEEAVRRGAYAEALKLADEANSQLVPEELAYWRGQALVRLGRLEDAAEAFYRVTSDHALYPYAARGIIYCAWASPAINFVEVCAPLTAAADAEVATVAQAAMAEYQLRYTQLGDSSTFDQLEKMATTRPEFKPLVKLLAIHARRREGDLEGSIEYARSLEHDPELSLAMRHRVRLELAELYYDKENAAEPASEPENADEGKGEETLLQFIAANPDSPLLEEAFRRLHIHGAVTNSDYTRNKLNEWAEDSLHPRRAAWALFSLLQENAGADSSAIANRASSELPGEPMTRTILQEQVRLLYKQGKSAQAALYLSLLDALQSEPISARSMFFHACQQWESPAEAEKIFLNAAEQADGSLLTPALVNSLICAMRAGDEMKAEQLLQAPASQRTRRALLLTHAGLIAEQQPQRALKELEEVMTLNPTPTQVTDVLLDHALYALENHSPSEAIRVLSEYDAAARAKWSDAQILRYAALMERALDRMHTVGEKTKGDAEDILLTLYHEANSIPLKEGLALHMADRYAQSGRHRRALELLLDLALHQSTGEQKAATLLYAGQESSKLGSLAALEHAVRIYAECARQGSSLTASATIAQAAILVRINRTAEAFELLNRLQHTHTNLTPAEQAHILTVQADAYSADYTPEGNTSALAACEKIVTLPNLPAAWRSRAWLQHAAISSRSNLHEQALQDYRRVMDCEAASANAEDEHNCFVYYYASAGAVYQLLQMERYSDAAALADTVAAWPGTPSAPSPTLGPKSEAFRRWAQNIRQTHYLPSSAVFP